MSLRSATFPCLRPAIRYIELSNDFKAPKEFPAPSIRWDRAKSDAGIRVGSGDWADLKAEYLIHDARIWADLDLDELLVTLRIHLL